MIRDNFIIDQYTPGGIAFRGVYVIILLNSDDIKCPRQ